MRWVTPQELSKIARRSPASDKRISERTIRHMALQKRLTTKKEGKTWLIDPASAIKAGLYIEPAIFESLRVTKDDSSAEAETTSDTPKQKKKYKTLGDLGVYSELKALYHAYNSGLPEPVKDTLKQALHHLALGFFEYTRVNKVEYFRRSRKLLVGAIVEDDLASDSRSEWRNQVENSILPGIVGLIRKLEDGRYGRRGQLKTKG